MTPSRILSVLAATAAVLVLPATSSATAATPPAEPSAKYLGAVGEERPLRARITVQEPGTYVVRYFVSYPETTGRLRTTVDGKRLRDTVSPAVPDAFGVFVDTKPFELTAGTHQFVLRGLDLPSVSASADLFGPLPAGGDAPSPVANLRTDVAESNP